MPLGPGEKKSVIPTAPKPKSSGATRSVTQRTAARSSGGGGYNPNAVTGAERRANAALKKAQKKASDKYKSQAETLQLQADSLAKALGSGFKDALDKRLANVDLIAGQNDSVLLESYRSRVGDLEGANADNQKAFSDTNVTNLLNRARERGSAISEAMNNGAGESDVLKSQLMSLRSWDANQNESNRSFFDSLRSINSSLGDLNADTKTARVNAKGQQLNDRDQLYTQYYNDKSEAYTQLGNIQGQQAELYGLANEQVSSSSSKASQKKYSKLSGTSFQNAEDTVTTVHANPGIDQTLLDWQGTADFKGEANNSLFENAGTNDPVAKKPEGAKLRKWTA